MLRVDSSGLRLEGPAGSLAVQPDDEVVRKLAMIYEGQCEGLGATAAARKHGFSRGRYYQVLDAFAKGGTSALLSAKRGPKTHYRCTSEVVRQVVRHRHLDPDVSAEVIAQKLRQRGFTLSVRSVQRVIAHYGLQKKTPRAAT